MMFTKAFTLAAAFATLSSALPHVVRRNDTSSGSVTIVNNMNQDIYAWSVADSVNPMQTLSANGGSYTEQWRVNSNGGGVSIKMSTTQEQVDVLQFEYTENGDTIFWDVSCIDMEPAASEFSKVGFSVSNTDTGNCPSIECAAGDDACAEAYLQPDDNAATHGCPINTGFTLGLGSQ